MNPEIEKFIDLALTDGKITDKERSVILKKATIMGFDADEVELVLNAKLHLLQAGQNLPLNENVGNVRNCPSCGNSVKSIILSCPTCGHEFQNREANKSIKELVEKMEREENKQYEDEEIRTQKKAQIIAQFPIPQTKEDIFEFLFFAAPFLDNASISSVEKNAWITKTGQAILKARLVSKTSYEDDFLLDYESKLERAIGKEKKYKVLSDAFQGSQWLIFMIAAAFGLFFIIKFYSWILASLN